LQGNCRFVQGCASKQGAYVGVDDLCHEISPSVGRLIWHLFPEGGGAANIGLLPC
jgi:hypothetical protein